jgi:hypothetical protein
MKKVVLGIIALLGVAVAGGVGGAWVLGSGYPAEHTVVLTVASRQGPAAVWRVVSNLEKQPTWRGDLSAVRQLADIDGKEAWEEVTTEGQVMTLVTTAWDPPRAITREIVDDGWFSGSWTVELVPQGMGTRVTLTEHGRIPNPFVRLMAHRFIGVRTTGTRYLRALADHLGDPQNAVEALEVVPAEGGSRAAR